MRTISHDTGSGDAERRSASLTPGQRGLERDLRLEAYSRALALNAPADVLAEHERQLHLLELGDSIVVEIPDRPALFIGWA